MFVIKLKHKLYLFVPTAIFAHSFAIFEKLHKDGMAIEKMSVEMDPNNIHSVVLFNDSKALENLLQVRKLFF